MSNMSSQAETEQRGLAWHIDSFFMNRLLKSSLLQRIPKIGCNLISLKRSTCSSSYSFLNGIAQVLSRCTLFDQACLGPIMSCHLQQIRRPQTGEDDHGYLWVVLPMSPQVK